jgi:AcrR family transcriptional regulator
VSRGSFYWHFKDLSVFHELLLRNWVENAVKRPLVAAGRRGSGSAEKSLDALIDMAFTAAPALERAVHAWAAVDHRAAKAVADVNMLRIEHLRRMLEAVGFDARAAEIRATAIYWAFLGRYAEPGLPGGEACIALIKQLAAVAS